MIAHGSFAHDLMCRVDLLAREDARLALSTNLNERMMRTRQTWVKKLKGAKSCSFLSGNCKMSRKSLKSIEHFNPVLKVGIFLKSFEQKIF